MGAYHFYGTFVADRIGIVALGQRGERLAVADVGAVLADADNQLLAVQLAQRAGQGEESQRLFERDGFDQLSLLERGEAALLALGTFDFDHRAVAADARLDDMARLGVVAEDAAVSTILWNGS